MGTPFGPLAGCGTPASTESHQALNEKEWTVEPLYNHAAYAVHNKVKILRQPWKSRMNCAKVMAIHATEGGGTFFFDDVGWINWAVSPMWLDFDENTISTHPRPNFFPHVYEWVEVWCWTLRVVLCFPWQMKARGFQEHVTIWKFNDSDAREQIEFRAGAGCSHSLSFSRSHGHKWNFPNSICSHCFLMSRKDQTHFWRELDQTQVEQLAWESEREREKRELLGTHINPCHPMSFWCERKYACPSPCIFTQRQTRLNSNIGICLVQRTEWTAELDVDPVFCHIIERFSSTKLNCSSKWGESRDHTEDSRCSADGFWGQLFPAPRRLFCREIHRRFLGRCLASSLSRWFAQNSWQFRAHNVLGLLFILIVFGRSDWGSLWEATLKPIWFVLHWSVQHAPHFSKTSEVRSHKQMLIQCGCFSHALLSLFTLIQYYSHWFKYMLFWWFWSLDGW